MFADKFSYLAGTVAMNQADTIFALSSGPPPAAIAVVRISGPQSRFGLETMIGSDPEPRRATLATVRHPATKEPIDQALVLWFPGPNSETGEDSAELQLHGGRAVVAATLRALGSLPGFRLAEAGEFTRRAFENGRLDLTAVEGLADLVGAETESQRRQAFRQLTGLLGNRAETWRSRLIDAQALIEAGIDFSDEGDVPDDLVGPARKLAAELRAEIDSALADAGRGERLREGLTVVIAGPPNAGKSTLLNALARREVAIVSPYPGTTRDVLEVHLDVGGYPVTVLDTAGMREATDPVERIGVERARQRAEAADLVLWVVDGTDFSAAGEDCSGGFGALASPGPVWLVRNKIDLAGGVQRDAATFVDSERVFVASAMTGEGIREFVNALRGFATDSLGQEPALVVRERQRQALSAARDALERAIAPGIADELLAEELRAAAAALGRLLGRVDVEDVLDRLFAEFCIGK